MVGLAIVALLAGMCLLVWNPVRTLWGLAIGMVATLGLAELVGVRGAVGVGATLMLLTALSGRRTIIAAPEPVRAPADAAMARAWARLAGVGGFWSRNRIAAVRARYDAVAASTAECDPFSTAGALRIKLERYIPELIDTTLDEHARAGAGRRRAITGELLTELEQFVTRMEDADPDGKLRADRLKALRTHLRREEE